MAWIGSSCLHVTVGGSADPGRRRIICEDLRCVLVLMSEQAHMGSQVAILKHDLQTFEVNYGAAKVLVLCSSLHETQVSYAHAWMPKKCCQLGVTYSL